MGKASRDKGNRTERAIVNRLRAAGVEAERIPLSGAAQGSFAGDIRFAMEGEPSVAEVKCRANGFAQLYSWLGDHDAVFVKRDRSEPLAVIPMATFIRLIGGEE